MNIYKISQEKNRDYDTYDSAIVVAPNVEIARRMHPAYQEYENELEKNEILPLTEVDFTFLFEKWHEEDTVWRWDDWVLNVNDVKVELVGTTELYTQPIVLCASYNAG